MASGYTAMSGVATEPCLEGGQDLTGIASGDWAAYSGINLTGANAFVARVASAGTGGNIEIHLDSPGGTLAGTCAVPGTGGWQNFTDAYCALTNAAGTHTVYLVFTGGGGSLFNVEFFGTFAPPPALSHRLLPGNTYALQSLLNGQYVSATNNGNNTLAALGTSVSVPEEFQIYDAGGGNIGLLALVNTNYVSADNNGNSPLIANRTGVGSWENYTEFDAGNGNIALRAMNNGKYVTVSNTAAATLIAKSAAIATAESLTPQFITGATPATPGGLMAWSGNSQVALTWAASSGASSYSLKRATSYSGTYSIIASNGLNLSYADTNLANGTTYYYTISAQNPAGVSTDSLPVVAIVGALPRWTWTVSASVMASGNPPDNAIDGNINTRWSSGTPQTNGMWFQIDLGAANTFRGLVLDAGSSSSDYPRGYQVNISNDGLSWGSPVATGSGNSAVITILFGNQNARYIRVTQTGSVSGLWWSMHEVNVLGTVPATPTALAGTSISGSQINLAWNAATGAGGYNIKRASNSGGPYATVAWNLTDTTYTDFGLTGGSLYYYVVTATNAFGESPVSNEVAVRPVSAAPTALNFVTGGGQILLSWPMDHTGWRLEAQTNGLNVGLGTNWATIPNSTGTNAMMLPITANGSVLFRLRYQ
ncbi:MAG: carbohydrate-binding protein [Verrucomicrobia bacterium]|nr:carbohydrate-binding protein [Verrucomicrobiota bacterium]